LIILIFFVYLLFKKKILIYLYRYDSLSLVQALRNMPDFRWCKNAGCGSGQIHSGGGKYLPEKKKKKKKNIFS
jgi:hypothetical protein